MHYIDSSVIGNNPPARRKSPYEEYHIKRVIFTYEDLQANLISVGDMYRSMAGQSKSARVGMFRRLESIAREFAEMASQKAGLLPTGERILPYSLDKMVERYLIWPGLKIICKHV